MKQGVERVVWGIVVMGMVFGGFIGNNSVRAAESSGREYTVGIDDVLDIIVIKPEPMASTVTVAPDGAITVPYIGNVPVDGLSLPEIQEQVQERLADGYMEFPVVSVSLRQIRSRKFVIYGEIARPGSYPVEDSMTLLHAITVAGGFIVPGSTGRIKLLRPRPDKTAAEEIEWDITAILRGAGHDVNVLAGDTIVVSVDKYFVYGQVVRPGAYPVEENMTLLHALTVSGGFIQSGATGSLKLLRSEPDRKRPQIFEFDIIDILSGAQQNIIVQANDTIVVTLDKYFISGEVVRPGAYPVEAGMTLLHAINVAGGFAKIDATGRVKLLRPQKHRGAAGEINSDSFKNMSSRSQFDIMPDLREIDGEANGLLFMKTEYITVVDLSINSVMNGGYQETPVLPGDAIVVSIDKYFVSGRVARPGEYPINEQMSLLNAITQAGGFTEQSGTGIVKLVRQKGSGTEAEVSEWDIADILNGVRSSETVRSGDTIIVSDNRFFVYGEVVRPGIYPLENGTTAFTAVAMAGGFTKFGSASRVKILRMNEDAGTYDTANVNLKEIISGKSKIEDAILSDGDIVVVSEGAF